MVIDTSAIIAIFLHEPGFEYFLNKIDTDKVRLISSVNAYEAAIVLINKKGITAKKLLDMTFSDSDIQVIAADKQHYEKAFNAWMQFGKGRHPAKLNLGDCFAYALAKSSGEPLLFKGNDFNQTDLMIA